MRTSLTSFSYGLILPGTLWWPSLKPLSPVKNCRALLEMGCDHEWLTNAGVGSIMLDSARRTHSGTALLHAAARRCLHERSLTNWLQRAPPVLTM